MGEGSELDDDPGTDQGDVILITDASAEGANIAVALRERGFTVVDAPLTLLEARVLGESPRVVLLDVDQVGALERLERLRDLPGGDRAELLLLGDPLRAAELGQSPASANVFARPIDVDALLERIEQVAKPIGGSHSARGTTPPPSYAPRRETSPPVGQESDVPPLSDFPPLADPLDATSILPGVDEPLASLANQVSPELDELLRQAEQRVGASSSRHSSIPAPDNEVDMLLPPEMLAPLAEPLDADEEEEEAIQSRHAGESFADLEHPPPETSAGRGTHAEGTGVERPVTGAADTGEGEALRPSRGGDDGPLTELFDASVDELHRALSSGEPPPSPAAAHSAPSSSEQRSTEYPPTGPGDGPLHAPAASAAAPAGWSSLAMSAPVTSQTGYELPRPPSREVPIPPTRGAPETAALRTPPHGAADLGAQIALASHADLRTPSQRVNLPEVFSEGEEPRVVATAIGGRLSGALALSGRAGVRRIVLNDGDIVTAASGAADETLLAFLAGRGDVDRDTAGRLEGKLPPSGRHAGAALIANGHLSQDDLWPVLRAHAEWIIGRAITGGAGTCELEPDPPGRLKAEPNVFGGATGAEVLVETLRRVLPVEYAVVRLGGDDARIAEGPRAGLLGECALSPGEEELVRTAHGRRVRELTAQYPEIASVLYGLAQLDVISVTSPTASSIARAVPEVDPLDEEAVRERVRARRGLVEEGDYFQLLGIPRSATSYEVRRAYLELRRAFEPARLLTARTADLRADVEVIIEVLDEAFEILRDHRRKERYRRAIEAGPPA